MSREDFVAVAARLFSIYLVYLVISGMPGAVQATTLSDDGMEYLPYFLVAFVVLLAVAALLWVFPLTLARKLLPVMKEPRSDTAINGPLALSLGISILGLWLLAFGITDAFYWLAMVVRVSQLADYQYQWSPDQIAGMVATGVQVALALLLVLGNAGIGRLVLRFRYGKDSPAD